MPNWGILHRPLMAGDLRPQSSTHKFNWHPPRSFQAATIERCMRCARGVRQVPGNFRLGSRAPGCGQPACAAGLRGGAGHGPALIRRERLGIPQSARDVFTLLAQAGWIEATLAGRLQKMVGFSSIAGHGYRALQLPVVGAVITKHLGEFTGYSKLLLLEDAGRQPNLLTHGGLLPGSRWFAGLSEERDSCVEIGFRRRGKGIAPHETHQEFEVHPL